MSMQPKREAPVRAPCVHRCVRVPGVVALVDRCVWMLAQKAYELFLRMVRTEYFLAFSR